MGDPSPCRGWRFRPQPRDNQRGENEPACHRAARSDECGRVGIQVVLQHHQQHEHPGWRREHRDAIDGNGREQDERIWPHGANVTKFSVPPPQWRPLPGIQVLRAGLEEQSLCPNAFDDVRRMERHSLSLRWSRDGALPSGGRPGDESSPAHPSDLQETIRDTGLRERRDSGGPQWRASRPTSRSLVC